LLQEAVATAAHDDLSAFGIDTQTEAATLQELVTTYETQDRDALQQAERLAQEMNRASYDLRRSMLGLDTIRVMGLVESGRLGPEGNRIGATMDQIGQCHDSIVTLLQRIKDNAGIVNTGVTGLRMHKQKPAAIAAQ
jgi:aerotaxis receptor